jgi:hypothetical protein
LENLVFIYVLLTISTSLKKGISSLHGLIR